jgi:hypothetical protein
MLDGKIYIFGGVSGWPSSAYGIVEVLEPLEDAKRCFSNLQEIISPS